MANINAIKSGLTINLAINGKLLKKACADEKEAKELFEIILECKNNPNEENIKRLNLLFNKRLRIAMKGGFEYDPDTGENYLCGFNTPIPQTLFEIIEEYIKNNYPITPIMNFWKLLMINPDTRVRKSLFDFIKKHDFVLTDMGYMLTYKSVYYAETEKTDETKTNGYELLDEFVSNQYLTVKSKWKHNPVNYCVYRTLNDNKFHATKYSIIENWDFQEKGIEPLGNLNELYRSIIEKEESENIIVHENKTIYTDMHTRKMRIELGVPVKMDRKDCDSDPAIDCSYGLHVGATKYVENFGSYGKCVILACLVNPANVVAVPNYDHSKMRVTEYFPFAVATYENGSIDIVEQKYFENDYLSYEADELEKMVEAIQNDEKPIEIPINCKADERSLTELTKIIEARMFDITVKEYKTDVCLICSDDDENNDPYFVNNW